MLRECRTKTCRAHTPTRQPVVAVSNSLATSIADDVCLVLSAVPRFEVGVAKMPRNTYENLALDDDEHAGSMMPGRH